MLVPLTRQKFEQVIPLIATGLQYKYYWGKFSNFLQRLLISVVAVVAILLVTVVFRLEFASIVFVLGVVSAFFGCGIQCFKQVCGICNAAVINMAAFSVVES